ncbi:MAG: hypothetical protein WCK58_11435 [Chloroflexota bacterium]
MDVASFAGETIRGDFPRRHELEPAFIVAPEQRVFALFGAVSLEIQVVETVGIVIHPRRQHAVFGERRPLPTQPALLRHVLELLRPAAGGRQQKNDRD